MVSVFNWGETPASRVIRLKSKSRLTDFFATGEDLGVHEGTYSIPALPGHSARLIEVRALAPGRKPPGGIPLLT